MSYKASQYVPHISELVKDPCSDMIICLGKGSDGGLKPGAIVGIVLGVVIFLILCVVGILSLIGIIQLVCMGMYKLLCKFLLRTLLVHFTRKSHKEELKLGNADCEQPPAAVEREFKV